VFVHLGSAGVPREQSCIPTWEQLAASDGVGRHRLVDDVADADAVLFTESHLLGRDWMRLAIRRSAAFRAAPNRAYVYDETDLPWCALPGLYVSMPARSLRPALQVSVPYFAVEDPRGRVDDLDDGADRDLLFSLAASRSHPCRVPLFDLRSARGIVDEAVGFTFYDPSSKDFALRRRRFAELVVRSKFVLCPRGSGTSSIRLYEVMAAGRVPVVISDDWVPPPTIDWPACSLRWPEGRTEGLVELLEAHETDAEKMGARARAEYDSVLAPSVAFDTQIEALRGLCVAGRPRMRRLGYPDARTAKLAGLSARDLLRDALRS
jgi:hypothetical protein